MPVLHWQGSTPPRGGKGDGMGPSAGSRRGGARPLPRRAVMALACLGTLVPTLDSGMTGVAFPALARAFRTDISTVLWVQVAYYLTSTGVLLTAGWVSDVLGRRRVYALGFAVMGLGMGLASLAPSILALVAFRVFQALGAAMLIANSQALATAVHPPGQRGRAMGLISSVAGLGLAAGPFLGGLLLDRLGWPSIFYTRAPLSAVGAVWAWHLLRAEEGRRPAARADLAGALLLFGSVGALLLGLNQAGRMGPDAPPWVWGLMALGLALVPPFLWVERRAERPVLDPLLLRHPPYVLSVLAILFHFLAWGGITLVLPFYLLDVLGYSQSRMGLLLSVFPGIRVVGGPLSGWLSDRIGPRLPTGVGLTLLALGLVLLARLGPFPSFGAVLGALAVMGVGSALFAAPNASAIMGSVPPDRLGTAAASIGTGRQIGLSAGIALAGALYSLREPLYRAAGAPEALAITWGLRDTLLLGAGMAGVGALLSFLRQRPAPPAARE